MNFFSNINAIRYLTTLLIGLCTLLWLPAVAAPFHEAPEPHEKHEEQEQQEKHSNKELTLNSQQQQHAGLHFRIAGPAQLDEDVIVFGLLKHPPTQQFRVNAAYGGLIEDIRVEVGEAVSKGQVLALVRNNSTLQSYQVLSPANGIVTQRWLNRGDFATAPLLEISNLQQLWFDISIFPQVARRVHTGMTLQLIDLEQPNAATVQSSIRYIAPQLSMGHITTARAELDTAQLPPYWRAGMHLQARLILSRRQVPVAVTQSAIQQLQGQPVVFVEHQGRFTPVHVELGLVAPPMVEIKAGLKAGDRYVSEQSFVLKAELGKASAAHTH